MVLAWAILCHVGVRLIAKQAILGVMSPLAAVKLMEKQLHAFRWLGLPVILLCLGGFGLGRIWEHVPVFQDWMVLRAVVLLLPGLLITTATWSAENYYGALVGYTDRSLASHVRATALAFRTGTAWLVVPVLILMLFVDLFGLFVQDQKVAGWIVPIAVIGCVPIGMPFLMRFLFKTQAPSEGDARWVQSILRAANIRGTRFLRWETGGNSFNAMVSGIFPSMRTLLLSDRVLDELPREQIAMVILHEAAHVKRLHVPVRMMAVFPAWGGGVLVTKLLASSGSTMAANYAMAAGTVAGIMLTIVMLRLISYRTEHDADLHACKLAASLNGQVQQVPTSTAEAAAALSAALGRIGQDHAETTRSTWLHPGLPDRLRFLADKTAPSTTPTVAGTIANPA